MKVSQARNLNACEPSVIAELLQDLKQDSDGDLEIFKSPNLSDFDKGSPQSSLSELSSIRARSIETNVGSPEDSDKENDTKRSQSPGQQLVPRDSKLGTYYLTLDQTPKTKPKSAFGSNKRIKVTPQRTLSDSIVPMVKKADRKCSFCNVIHTPLWRVGPPEFPTLCNSCGIKWKRGSLTTPKPSRKSAEKRSRKKKVEESEGSCDEITLMETRSEATPEDKWKSEEFTSESPDEKPIDLPEQRLSFAELFLDHTLNLPLEKVPIVPVFHDSIYYPAPWRLTSTQDRMEFLASRIGNMNICQVAKLFYVLGKESLEELDRALKSRRDAKLDVSMMDDQEWSQLCSIFYH